MALTPEGEAVLWWLLLRRSASGEPQGLCGPSADPDPELESQFQSETTSCLDYDAFTQVAAELRYAVGPSADTYFQVGAGVGVLMCCGGELRWRRRRRRRWWEGA